MTDAGAYFKPKNYINNLSGIGKTQAMHLGESFKDISESIHDGLSSKEKISLGHLFQLKPAQNLIDEVLELLKEKAIQRQSNREIIISKIDVKPMVDEFLDECSKITTVSDKLRSKIESRMDKIASTLNDVLVKISDMKPNIKDRMESIVEKIGSNKPTFDNIAFPSKDSIKIVPKNNFSGLRKIQAIQLGECLKEIFETIDEGMSASKEKIRNILQMKPARNLFDKLLELLKEKSIERQKRREVFISKIDVKPIFDEFLDECSKITVVSNKLRSKFESRMDKLASSMTGILEKTSELKPNIQDRIDSVVDKVGSNKPNFDDVDLDDGQESSFTPEYVEFV